MSTTARTLCLAITLLALATMIAAATSSPLRSLLSSSAAAAKSIQFENDDVGLQRLWTDPDPCRDYSEKMCKLISSSSQCQWSGKSCFYTGMTLYDEHVHHRFDPATYDDEQDMGLQIAYLPGTILPSTDPICSPLTTEFKCNLKSNHYCRWFGSKCHFTGPHIMDEEDEQDMGLQIADPFGKANFLMDPRCPAFTTAQSCKANQCRWSKENGVCFQLLATAHSVSYDDEQDMDLQIAYPPGTIRPPSASELWCKESTTELQCKSKSNNFCQWVRRKTSPSTCVYTGPYLM